VNVSDKNQIDAIGIEPPPEDKKELVKIKLNFLTYPVEIKNPD
jgi:hypothetical protein